MKKYTIKDFFRYFYIYFVVPTVLLGTISIIIVNTYLTGNIKHRLRSTIPVRISEVFQTIYERSNELGENYKDKMNETLDRFEKFKDSGGIKYVHLQNEFKEKYSNIFSQLNYFMLDRSGKIIETSFIGDYSSLKDLGCNIDFLLKCLKNDEYCYDFFTHERKKGNQMLYAFKKLKNNTILGIGLQIKDSYFKREFEFVRKISIFSDYVRVECNNLTIFESEQLSNKKLHFPENLYKEEIAYKVTNPTWNKETKVYVRLNLFPLFLLNLTSVFIFFFQIIILLLLFGYISKNIISELNKITQAIKEYGETGLISQVEDSKIADISFAINSFQNLAETISANLQELTASNEELDAAFKEIGTLSDKLKQAFYDFSYKLADIAEGLEEETGKHLQRVQHIVSLVCDKLISDEQFKEDIINYSVLHDIGKIFIPKEILNKPGPLTESEWETMKKHTILAEKILSHPEFKVALNIAKYHHENYDGTGYMYGLRGGEIPIEARIVKIADVYDALVSTRPYKKAYTKEEALKIIFEGDNKVKPSHFDPKVLEAFREIIEQI